MAELVDALVSEASEETHGGSSPLGHTKKVNYSNILISSSITAFFIMIIIQFSKK